jgi:hypothetical protein
MGTIHNIQAGQRRTSLCWGTRCGLSGTWAAGLAMGGATLLPASAAPVEPRAVTATHGPHIDISPHLADASRGISGCWRHVPFAAAVDATEATPAIAVDMAQPAHPSAGPAPGPPEPEPEPPTPAPAPAPLGEAARCAALDGDSGIDSLCFWRVCEVGMDAGRCEAPR